MYIHNPENAPRVKHVMRAGFIKYSVDGHGTPRGGAWAGQWIWVTRVQKEVLFMQFYATLVYQVCAQTERGVKSVCDV